MSAVLLRARTRAAAATRGAIADALARIEGRPVAITSIQYLAADRSDGDKKHVGYGQPILVTYHAGRDERRVVFRTMLPNWYGHDRRADRATLALLAYDTYGSIPDHVRALDVGMISQGGELVSLRGCDEPYLITTYADGTLYAHDLRRVEEEGRAGPIDLARAHALARWAARIHAERLDAPREVYERALRDLVGSGEGVFGIVDGYPEEGPIARSRLHAIERLCLDWRWRIRAMRRPIRRTHGDFHPYNVLFREGVDLTVLDASRGSAGEPADDLAAMSINFVFGGVTSPRAWSSGFCLLWDAFWSTYLDLTGDRDVLRVIAPFFAWRALVVASPVWYPTLSPSQRDRLLAFAERVLESSEFDPATPGL